MYTFDFSSLLRKLHSPEGGLSNPVYDGYGTEEHTTDVSHIYFVNIFILIKLCHMSDSPSYINCQFMIFL